jgi:predicted dehydrogenase
MKLALVGFDAVSRKVAETALQRNHELSGICSKFTATTTTWGTKNNVPLYSIPGRMLAIRGLDAVILSSQLPNSPAFILTALKQGKHIYVSGRPDFSVKMIGTLEKVLSSGRGRLFFETHLDHSSALNAMAAQSANGKIGNPGFIKLHSGWKNPSKKDLTPGGVVTEQLTHQFRWIIQHFGGIKKVFAQGVRQSGKRPLDYAMITLTLKKGLLVQVIGSYQTRITPYCRAEICGTDGMVQYDSADAPIQTSAGSSISPEQHTQSEQNWQAFENLVRGRSKGTQQAKHFLQAQRVALNALRSIKTGKPVLL